MTLGEYISARRASLGMNRSDLSRQAGISHTEVRRIETGERKQPSTRVLFAIADALSLPHEEILKAAGLASPKDASPIRSAFPGLQSEKQLETVAKFADGLSRNAELDDEDLDDLYRQVEMFLQYAKSKHNSG